jgi:hypothetical protein
VFGDEAAHGVRGIHLHVREIIDLLGVPSRICFQVMRGEKDENLRLIGHVLPFIGFFPRYGTHQEEITENAKRNTVN